MSDGVALSNTVEAMPDAPADQLRKDRLLTINEVANLLRYSDIYKLRERNELPRPMKIGWLTRWRLASPRCWLAHGCPVA